MPDEVPREAGALPHGLIGPPAPGEPVVMMRLRLSLYAELVRLARGLGQAGLADYDKPVERLMEHAVAELLQRHQTEVERGAVLHPFPG